MDPDLGGYNAMQRALKPWKIKAKRLEEERERVGARLLEQDKEIKILRSALQDIADKETAGLEPDVYAYMILNPE